LILEASKNSIRVVLKSNDTIAIENQDRLLKAIVFESVDLYTGANLETPYGISQQEKKSIEAEHDHMISSCVEFIKKQFAGLAPLEIKEAFCLLASGKLKLDVKTYGGKFKVMHMGQILNAYIDVRKKIICDYQKITHQENLWAKKEGVEDLNKESKNDVLLCYSYLLDYFRNTGNRIAVENEIMGYFGKILVQEGIIKFSAIEKSQIADESRQIALLKIKDKIANPDIGAIERKGLQTIASAVKNGIRNEDFETAWVSIYAKLIVIKSIIKDALTMQ